MSGKGRGRGRGALSFKQDGFVTGIGMDRNYALQHNDQASELDLKSRTSTNLSNKESSMNKHDNWHFNIENREMGSVSNNHVNINSRNHNKTESYNYCDRTNYIINHDDDAKQIDKWAELKSALNILSNDNQYKAIDPIVQAVKSSVTCPEDFHEVLDLMYMKCTQDYTLSIAISHCCHKLSTFTVADQTFRAKLLGYNQKYCNELKHLKTNNKPLHFAVSSMLCMLLVNLRNATGHHINILESPACLALESLLENKAGDADMECAAILFPYVSKILRKTKAAEHERLLAIFRSKLLCKAGSKTLRLLLISTLEQVAAET